MFQPNFSKLDQALLPILLVVLLVDYTEPSYSAKSTIGALETQQRQAIQARSIDFDTALGLLADYGKIISHEEPAKRLEVFQNSYNLLRDGALRGNVSQEMINFLHNGIQAANDTKELTKLVEQTQNTVEAEKEKAFPTQPNFIERLFGVTQKRGPYDNFDLSQYNLFGSVPSPDKTKKDDVKSGADSNVNNPPKDDSSATNNQAAQTDSQSKGGFSNIVDSISSIADLFSGKKKLKEEPQPQQANGASSPNNPSGAGQSNSAGNSEVKTTTTTKAPAKSGFDTFKDILGIFG